MLKRITIGAVLLAVVLSLQLSPTPAAARAGSPRSEAMPVPGTGYIVVPEEVRFAPAGNPGGQRLLAALVAWIAANFDLPATDSLPHVTFASAGVIASLHREGLPSWQREGYRETGHREVVSVYDDVTMTIYLPEGWRGATPAELSILVHELVHHLQRVAGLRFACPQQREELAYDAQERWLNLFGSTLEVEFELDPFTLLATTRCGF